MRQKCLRFQLISFLVIQINGLSILSDKADDGKDITTASTKRVDVLQQLLNQETIIRMSLEKNVRELMREVVDMKNNLKGFESITENLQNDMKGIIIENHRLKDDNLGQLLNNVTELLAEKGEEIYERVNRSLEIQGSKHLKPTVAFHAKMTSSKRNLGGYQVVIYEETLLNEGNAYNTKNGKFTAPIDGIYHFDWTTVAYMNKYFITQLVKEGTIMGANYCTDISKVNSNLCSSSAIVQMKANQEVWIRTYMGYGQYVVGDWCYFSGHILF
ncbi:uncharacterized protein LOC134272647 [Saccostrea cucullata]|uniref:uncharacterized protein LOC134272647 n=1 Tax=Saccostrea cuccullata TaxID=36930 RepID=UPI002ED60838